MNYSATSPAALAESRRYLPLALLLFVGSGCAALVYEIVWFQLLELVIGSSAVSLGVLLGTYMGGMCLGSLLLPRFISRRHHPLRIYGLLELGIGIFGVLVLFLVPAVARIYVASVGHGTLGLVLRGAVCAICLLPPTLLMGATLPAISRWVEATPRGVSWLGFFYGGNIAGAVFGSLLAGFYLLRVYDMHTATYVAAIINAAVAAAAIALAKRSAVAFEGGNAEVKSQPAAPGSWAVYLTIGLSGLCALGAQVVWTRLLSLLLGATVYTFSIILAVFLVGLGIGSSVGSVLARKTPNPRLLLGLCQILLTLATGWTAYMLTKSLPFWPINPALNFNPWLNFQVDLARCFWAILPPAILWGASFPLALAAVASPGQDPGRLVGRVYAANTLGAILGAVGGSLLLVSWLGTHGAQKVLIALSGAAALVMWAPFLWSSASPRRKLAIAVSMLAAMGVTAKVVSSVGPVPWKLVAHGRYLPTYGNDREAIYVGEGVNASVAVTQMHDGIRNFHVSGKVEASSDPEDMRLQRMLGHIPALLHPNPRTVLVVGCGAGVTAGSFLTYPSVERVVICEIEPLIPQKVAGFFAAQNYNVVKDPRVQIVYDDARHFVLTTKEKFDIITSDPIHPWVKGAATLYTKEYFEMVKRHLNTNGLVTQWVPLYESNSEVVKSEVATFFSVFPHGTIWGNDNRGAGYDTVMLGSAEPMKIDVDAVQKRLEANPSVAESMHEVGMFSAIGMFARYAGRRKELEPWLKGAEINRDRNLRLQYLAGLASNLYQEENIFEEILFYRNFPDDLFFGSGELIEEVKESLKSKSQP